MLQSPRSVRVTIDGRVTGVGFRFWLQQQAARNNIRGWVRNTPDGRVEAFFAGDEQNVQRLINACHTGPSSARIEQVSVSEDTGTEPGDSFEIR